MFCEKCGKQIADNSLFCEYCGSAVHSMNHQSVFQTGSSIPPSNNQSHKKNKRPVFSKKTIGFGLIIVVFIVVGIYAYNKIYKSSEARVLDPSKLRADDFPKTTTPSYIQQKNDTSLNAYLDELKNKESDIEGWSEYDKYAYGLQIFEDSDTDGDGLSDKDEIEIYGSDPLKISTAGDLFTDSEKVNAGKDPSEYIESDEKDKIRTYGAFTIYRASPRDIDTSVIDRTDEYKQPNASLLNYLPDKFYYAYEVCSYDGARVDVNLSSFASELGIDAKNLDVEAHATQRNPYKKKRTGDTVVVTFEDVQPWDSGIGMKGYDFFIVDKKSLTDKIPFISGVRKWLNQSSIDQLGYQNVFGVVWVETMSYHAMDAHPSTEIGRTFVESIFKTFTTAKDSIIIRCPYNATDEEKQYALYAAEYLYYSVYGKPVQLNEECVTLMSEEEFEDMIKYRGDYKWNLILGLPSNLYNILDISFRNGELPAKYPWGSFIWTSNGFYNNPGLREYIAQRNTIFKSNSPDFSVDDEFCFANFETDYLIDTTDEEVLRCGVCAGLAQVAAEVYNLGSVRSPASEYAAEVRFKDHYVTQTLAYDITQFRELDTFFDRYLSDYREMRGGVLEYDNVWELKADEQEFLKMVTCYWRYANDLFNQSVAYEDTLMNNQEGFLLDWETVENATRYLDDHEILICTMNINNMYDQGHAVNLVGYERGYGAVDYAGEFETVTFDVYDSNFPGGFLKLECMKIPAWEDRYTMIYRYNSCSDEYYASFLLDQYIIGKEEGTKCIKFAIFNDKGQCLNIKL